MDTPQASSAPQGASTGDLLSRLDSWLQDRRRWVLTLIAVTAVAVRIVYFSQLNAGPLVEMHRWDQSDMNYYDSWAKQILAGDWLSKDVWPPMHYWHGVIAGEWLKQNPELQKRLQAEAEAMGPRMTAERLQWRQWLGPGRFYQEPAYPYAIALTYLVFGIDHRGVFVWQMALGVLSVLLVYRLAERHFGPLAAVLAGLAAALCSPTLMYEGLLLRDSLIVFVGLLLADLTDRALAGRPRDWGLLGLALGAGLTVKGIFNLYLLGLLVLLPCFYWRQWRRLTWSAALLIAGVILPLLPLYGRNVAVGIPPLALAGNVGPGFIQNNAPDYTWEAPNPVNIEYFPRLLGQTGGQLLPAIWATLREHPSAGSILGMYLCKLDTVWHWWERPDNVSSYFYELYAPILGWLPVNFTLISPCAIVGLVLAARRFRFHIPLYLLLLTGMTPMIVFAVMGRFRLIMLAAAIPFAAYCLVQLVRMAAARRWGVSLGILLGVSCLAAWLGRPLPDVVPLARSCDYAATYGFWCQESVSQYAKGHCWRQAATILAEFARHEPLEMRDRIAHGQAKNQQEQLMALMLGELQMQCGRLLQLDGDSDAAASHLRRAEQLRKFATVR